MSRKSKIAKWKAEKRRAKGRGIFAASASVMAVASCELCGGISTWRARYGFCTCILGKMDYGHHGKVRMQDTVIFRSRFENILQAAGIAPKSSMPKTPAVPKAKAPKGPHLPTREEKRAFYESWEWRKLRFEVLTKYGARCMLCRDTEGKIVVDHIRPLSRHWDLRLDAGNLQVLCDACNMGKSNTAEDDFRPSLATGINPP
jgi:5-methylcytosine-specific restriction endonuclease McrA